MGLDDAPDRVFRVMLQLHIAPGCEEEFERTWAGVGGAITHQPANLGQWLLRSNDEPGLYYIMSDWDNESRFRQFEQSSEHLEHRRKLHPYRTGGSMTTMQVIYHLPAAAAVVR